MCDLEFDGTVDFHSTSRPRARKPHRCTVCNKTISPGTRYLRESFKLEGEVGADVCCMRCELDIDAFAAAHGGQRPFPGSFMGFLLSCLDDRDEESRKRWRPMFDRINARRERFLTEARP